MANFQVQPPEKFSFKPEDWSKRASGLSEDDKESQVNALMYSVGDKADGILQSFSLRPTGRSMSQ